MTKRALGFILAIGCSITATAINSNSAAQTKPDNQKGDQKEVLRLKTDLLQLQVVVKNDKSKQTVQQVVAFGIKG
jgi:hypothetical protein